MKFVSSILSFTVPKAVSMGPLIQLGFSRPTAEARSFKQYDRCKATIDRKVFNDSDRVFIEVRAEFIEDAVFGQADVIHDLVQAGLLEPIASQT